MPHKTKSTTTVSSKKTKQKNAYVECKQAPTIVLFSLRRIPNVPNLLFRLRRRGKEVFISFFRLPRIRKKVLLPKKKTPSAKKKASNIVFSVRRKMLRVKNRVLRCAQPASPRLLRQTAIFYSNVAPAQQQNSLLRPSYTPVCIIGVLYIRSPRWSSVYP